MIVEGCLLGGRCCNVRAGLMKGLGARREEVVSSRISEADWIWRIRSASVGYLGWWDDE